MSEASTSHTLSPKEKLMNIIRMTLLTLLLLPLSGWSKDLNLFVIQRSKNTNEVQYQLHVNDRCQIVSNKPIGVFWQLREVSPEKTEPLFFFSSRRQHTSCGRDWSSDVCSSDLDVRLRAAEHAQSDLERSMHARTRT